MDLNNKLEKLVDELKSKIHLGSAMQSVINNSYQENSTAAALKNIFIELGHDAEVDSEINKSEIDEATAVLQDIVLLDTSSIPQKLHWFHAKLLHTHNNDEILSSPLYAMLETYPPGSMLVDIAGTYWVRRATAAVTRHRFITVEDQEAYHEQKYLLTVPLTPTDDVITNPPLSWVKAAMQS